jgi:hypothetical protein
MHLQRDDLLGFNDEELSSFDDFELSSLDRVVANQEFKLGVIENVESLEEQFSGAFDLENFDLIVEDAFGGNELAKPARL